MLNSLGFRGVLTFYLFKIHAKQVKAYKFPYDYFKIAIFYLYKLDTFIRTYFRFLINFNGLGFFNFKEPLNTKNITDLSRREIYLCQYFKMFRMFKIYNHKSKMSCKVLFKWFCIQNKKGIQYGIVFESNKIKWIGCLNWKSVLRKLTLCFILKLEFLKLENLKLEPCHLINDTNTKILIDQL